MCRLFFYCPFSANAVPLRSMKTLTSPLPRLVQNKPDSIALTALIVGAIAIGFSAIFVRVSEAGPIATAFWRMALAFPAFFIWMQMEQRQAPVLKKRVTLVDVLLLIVAGVAFACDLMTWHLAINFTTVANSVLLGNLAPVFVTIGGRLFFRQRVTFSFIVGMSVALLGAAMLVGASFNLSMHHFIGDGLAMITAIFYGSYILLIKRLRESLPTGTIMTWVALITAIVILPVALLTEGTLMPFTLAGWAVLFGLALISHVGGQGLITFALAHLPASFSSVTLLLQPVMSAIFAWLLLGEGLMPWQMAGGLIVLVGIFLARRSSQLK